ncbi:MAG: type II toxin-antitoxin system RelE/ParE family toxin [Loktanella sp.]|nr:type II toxin-antitoxin system RelE/ParE family toxin [Loktanella sp.]
MPASDLTAYRLTPAAQDDVADIWLSTLQQWSIEQADRYAFDSLLFMPEMARERPEFDSPVRIHPSAEHLIVYRIQQDHLVILRVLGAGLDWQAILRAADQ